MYRVPGLELDLIFCQLECTRFPLIYRLDYRVVICSIDQRLIWIVILAECGLWAREVFVIDTRHCQVFFRAQYGVLKEKNETTSMNEVTSPSMIFQPFSSLA